MKHTFKVGDVVVVKSQGWDKPEIVGKKAKVLKVLKDVYSSNLYYGLKFFENIDGNDCYGMTRIGYGYYLGTRKEDDLELYNKQLEFSF